MKDATVTALLALEDDLCGVLVPCQRPAGHDGGHPHQQPVLEAELVAVDGVPVVQDVSTMPTITDGETFAVIWSDDEAGPGPCPQCQNTDTEWSSNDPGEDRAHCNGCFEGFYGVVA